MAAGRTAALAGRGFSPLSVLLSNKLVREVPAENRFHSDTATCSVHTASWGRESPGGTADRRVLPLRMELLHLH